MAIRRHTVAPGENLAKISQQYYGCTCRLTAIFQANREVLPTTMQVFPLQVLTIPHIAHPCGHGCAGQPGR